AVTKLAVGRSCQSSRVQINLTDAAADLDRLHSLAPRDTLHTVRSRLVRTGERRCGERVEVAGILTIKGSDAEAVAEGHVGRNLPAADNLVHSTVDISTECFAAAEGKGVERVSAKVRRCVSSTTTVVSLGVILVLEEVLRSLSLRLASPLFVAVGTEVAQGVGETLRKGVRELEIETVEVLLRHGCFQCIES